MYSYIDMHCDTLLHTLSEGTLYENKGMQSIELMHRAGQLCQFFAVFFLPEDERTMEDGEYFQLMRDRLYQAVEEHQDIINIAHNYEEIQQNRRNGLSSAVLTIEDGRIVGGELEKLGFLYRQGVRAMALTWNAANCFGYPNSRDEDIRRRGLSAFGREAVEEMNRLGMIIDVSHLSDGGFYDVADLSRRPFLASHSNCRAVTPHPRNMTDDMIRRLAACGGVAGVNFCPEFVSSRGDHTSRVEDLAAHVLHFIRVGGEECVGIGTDFDGIEGTLAIAHPTQMNLLFEYLEKKGVTPRQLDKIASGNVLRVIKESMR